jgi:hypothetical protein
LLGGSWKMEAVVPVLAADHKIFDTAAFHEARHSRFRRYLDLLKFECGSLSCLGRPS